MSCGCNKNKSNPESNNTPEESKKQLKDIFTSKLGMIASFAQSVASRGLTDKKIEEPIKQLRVLSCFGNLEYEGVISPCEHLKSSETPGKFFCGGCGCGDKPRTWLIGNSEEYSKLDYPSLRCPLKMPGFTNYEQSTAEEQQTPNNRKFAIENIDYAELQKIKVTTNETKAHLE